VERLAGWYLGLAVTLLLAGVRPVAAQGGCTFQLGFRVIRDQIPVQVGQCTENERFNPVNGNTEQHATGGLLVWRKADNWTAFTDGYRTWVNGPGGLQQRLNTERFAWEGSSGSTAAATAGPDAAEIKSLVQQRLPLVLP
jgi:hypothetical protein